MLFFLHSTHSSPMSFLYLCSCSLFDSPLSYDHVSPVYVHPKNKHCMFSSSLGHRLQILSLIQPLLGRLSQVRITFLVTNHKKACILVSLYFRLCLQLYL